MVNENLPKFVDNIFLFEKQKDEYEKIFSELESANKELKIKDKE
ncbi:MAG: hypothetical protein LBC61_04990 [Candidatus Peribacteria bacterium]|nr:hypothetical protein [Candidatus Peribacteria bacterium]